MKTKITRLTVLLLSLIIASCGEGGSGGGSSGKALIPSAPTELKATADDASVSLSWTSSEAKHRIHYATESFAGKGDYSLASGHSKVDISSDTSTNVTDLTNGTKYYFVVTAIKDGKESNASHEVSSTPAKPAVAKASTLNDTGITWGGDHPLGNSLDCTGVAISSQDCSHGRDAQAAAGSLVKKGGGKAGFDFTKLGANGNELAVQNGKWSDTGNESAGTHWSCVRDNVTGLVWEVKTKSGKADTEADIQAGNSRNIHHKDNSYRWGGITAIGRDHSQKEGDYYNDWNALVNGSNTASLCGFNDWRVPKYEELTSIVDNGKNDPSIDADYFPNTTSDWFWSASPYAYDSSKALAVYFLYGYGGYYNRSDTYRVRLVRVGQ